MAKSSAVTGSDDAGDGCAFGCDGWYGSAAAAAAAEPAAPYHS